MIEQIVGDVMTQSVRTIPPDRTASDVARLFAAQDIGSAIVVDPETGEYSGIVTGSDIMQQVAAGAAIDSVPVTEFLSTPLVTISSTKDIHSAASLMKAHSIRRLPVTEEGDLAGMLTTSDLTHYMPRLRNKIIRGRNDLVTQ